MFRLELDLRLHFLPLMHVTGRAISVTRTIELPFAPREDLAIAGQQLDECPEPMGFRLKDLTWDMDRKVFLAHTRFLLHDHPIAMIPDEIARWIALGWHLGSLMDAYQDPNQSDSDDDGTEVVEDGIDDWEVMERWPSMTPRSRPAHFNKLLRAVVRTMVELDNNVSVAYAIFKTKRFFTETEQKDYDSPAVKQFRKAESEYFAMPFEQQLAWQKRIKRTYPRLKPLIPKT